MESILLIFHVKNTFVESVALVNVLFLKEMSLFKELISPVKYLFTNSSADDNHDNNPSSEIFLISL